MWINGTDFHRLYINQTLKKHASNRSVLLLNTCLFSGTHFYEMAVDIANICLWYNNVVDKNKYRKNLNECLIGVTSLIIRSIDRAQCHCR